MALRSALTAFRADGAVDPEAGETATALPGHDPLMVLALVVAMAAWALVVRRRTNLATGEARRLIAG